MTQIFAHRGASREYPENTMLAFEAAYQQNADGIELDVQMTKDGILVVIHDETLDRTTNAAGWVKDYSYAELQHVDASYKFPQYAGQCQIPTLDQVFSWAKRKQSLFLNIELKNSVIEYPHLEKKVIHLIRQFQLENRVVLSSFNHYSLVEVHRLTDEIPTAILYREWLYEPWKYAKQLQSSGIHPHFTSLQKESIIRKAREENISVRAYTVNNLNVMEQLFRWNIPGIITDIPKKALEVKKKVSSQVL
ncbi:glycerophosphodiester phosphodiesterase [Bacillus alveayuensis]|jgi:glycerophosphoryl diester phosphodiesterase|uniref:glycerophosphodiester phosphodiesterase n=1 Tax=Aeribacillus alveayuensis TaxID=279215 RepID=UPI0005D1103A|nr:glycerophosphodiester phosphodiesterase [Bacillus alveayuensis]